MKNGWSIVAPQAVNNMVFNPSGETTGNFAAVGAATVTRSTTYQKYGLNSYRIQTAANGQGAEFTLSTLTNSTHYVTVRVKGKTPAQWGFSLSASPYIPAIFLENLGEGWSLYGLDFGANVANGKTFLRVGQIGPGSGDFYLDGIQVEAGGTWTTYCDGTQEGCFWNGIAHAASSTRSAESRAGGLVKDFSEDYGFFIEKIVGAGSATQTLSVDDYALLPGGELNSVKVDPRQFTIIGKFIADSEAELHDQEQALLAVLSPRSYAGQQPTKLRFTGARVPKEITAYYQGGLEGELNAFYCEFAPDEDNQWIRLNKWTEKCAIRFLAPDPFWYEIGESAAALDTNDSATLYYVVGKLKSTDAWSNLGLAAIPTTGGNINDTLLGKDGKIYFAGGFTGLNGVAGRDYIARYNPFTGLWETVGAPSSFTGEIFCLTQDAAGTIYAGGNFLNTAGDANADYIAKYSITTNVWSAVAGGGTGTVRAITFSKDGSLMYIGGTFLNWNADASSDRIVSYNGAVYAPLSTGMNDDVYALAVNQSDILFAGGFFSTAGGVAVDLIAQWNGTIWAKVGSGSNFDLADRIQALLIWNNNLLVGGTFDVSTSVADRIALWNGTSWTQLGSGLNNNVSINGLRLAPDNTIFIAGTFTQAGSIDLAEKFARWNGSTYSHVGISFPGGAAAVAPTFSKSDPVVNDKYSIFLGLSTTGTGSFSGLTAVINSGTEPVFPQIIFNRSGGTTAKIQILKNERTAKELLFDYDLQNGETLTVNLEPTKKSIISDPFGLRLDAVLANSDFGDWALLPGNNNVSSFVNISGAPTINTSLLWRDKYTSWN